MNLDNFHIHFQSPISRKRNSYRRIRAPKNPEPWGTLSTESLHSILDSMIADQREHYFRNLRPNYLKFREKVAEWIIDLGEYFDLHPTTTHAAISYMDRIQPNEKFCAFQWQMVAICCITTSAKYNELEEDIPDLESLSSIIQQEIPRNIHLEYELWVLKQMGWKLNARTPLGFLHSFDSLGVVFPSDVKTSFMFQCTPEQIQFAMDNLRVVLNKQFNLLSTVCILDPRFKPFPASTIASSILYIARKRLNLDPWPINLQHITRTDIQECAEIIELIDAITNDYSSQLVSSMKTLNMSVSPVKVPSTNNHGNGNNLYQTPIIQRVQSSNQQNNYIQRDFYTSKSEPDDYENINPFAVENKPLHLQRDISPYSVAVFPSPVG